MQSSSPHYQASGITLYAPPTSQLKLDNLSSSLINLIFSFLDTESMRRFATIKQKNTDLWNRLMQQALQIHFLELVAWAKPPQYKLETMPQNEWNKNEERKSEDVTLQHGSFYIDMPGPISYNDFLNYTVINPEGDVIKGMIKDQELRPLNIGFPYDFTLKDIQAMLPNILVITAARGDTYATAAEKLLDLHPQLKQLLLQKANVTDAASHHFTRITPYQYARWAKDTHMWKMLEKYMTPQEIQKQRDEMKTQQFKSQHGSYWDCPKKYDLHLLTVDKVPTLKELAEQNLPTLIQVQEKSKTPVFYLYGYQYCQDNVNGIMPALTELDKTQFQDELALLKEETSHTIQVTNTAKYQALHAEIETKQAHFVNSLINALQEYTHFYNGYERKKKLHPDKAAFKKQFWKPLVALWCKIGEAQRRVPMHIVNEYCRYNRCFDQKPDFKEKTLPRTSKLCDFREWSEVLTRCHLYLKQSHEEPSLMELIPMLFKKINKQGPADFYLLGHDPDTYETIISEKFYDVDNSFQTLNFRNADTLISYDSPVLTALSRIPIVFSDINGGAIIRGKFEAPRWQRLGNTTYGQYYTGTVTFDLVAVANLCHQRTQEVMCVEPYLRKSLKRKA